MKKKHDWASIQTFLNAHDRVLRTYSRYMDSPKQYKLKWVTPNYLSMECLEIQFTTYKGNTVRVDITKDVEIDDTNPKWKLARTFSYSYNANRPGVGNLIRYDSPDIVIGANTPHHHLYHHRHDWTSGSEKITKVDENAWAPRR